MSTNLAGKVAIVTGGSRGIGLAVATRLVTEGAQVVVTGRRAESLQAAVDSLRATAESFGSSTAALGVAGNADDGAHVDDTVDQAVTMFGGVDILVNNVGTNPAYGPLLETPPHAARKIFDVNVLGTLVWIKAASPQLTERRGAIVNVGSVAGLRPAGNIGMYGASKAALGHLTGQLAVELAPAVRVNAVLPGVVRTRFAGALFEGKEEEVVGRYPLGRLGEPADVAAAVAFLASGDASWITGQLLVVDGGLTLGGGV